MSISQTIERLSGRDNGLVANPFFMESYGVPSDYAIDGVGPGAASHETGAGQRLHTVTIQSNGATRSSVHRAPSGWRMFGIQGDAKAWISDGITGERSSAMREDNPFYQAEDSWRLPGFAVGATPGKVGGLAQRIGGYGLVGRKIRVTGSYRTILPDGALVAEVPLGMSVWLKSKVREAVSQGSTLSASGNGSITATPDAPSRSFTISSGTMTNVLPGDSLWIEGDHRPYEVNLLVSPTEVRIVGQFTRTAASLDWAIGRRDPDGVGNYAANWMGAYGIHVHKDPYLVGTVLRITEPLTRSLEFGLDQHFPTQDALMSPTADGENAEGGRNIDGATGTNLVAGDTVTNGGGVNFWTSITHDGSGAVEYLTYIHIKDYGTFQVQGVVSATELRLNGPTYPPAGLTNLEYYIYSDVTLSDAQRNSSTIAWGGQILEPAADDGRRWQGAVAPGLGTAPADDQTRVWYIDSTEWTDDPLDGNILVAESLALEDSTVHYFDEIIEIPDTMDMEHDEIQLIVLPTAPANFASLSNPVSVAWYGLQVEVLPSNDSGGNSTEDRMARTLLHSASGSNTPAWKSSVNLIQRQPQYVPVPFQVTPGSVFIANFDATDLHRTPAQGQHMLRIGAGAGARTINADFLFWTLPQFPIGSYIHRLDVQINAVNPHHLTIGLAQDFGRIYEAAVIDNFNISYNSIVSGYTGKAVIAHVVGGTPASDGGALHRHRVGYPWPDDNTLQPSAYGHQAHAPTSGQLMVGMIPLGSYDWDTYVERISGIAMVDARHLRGEGLLMGLDFDDPTVV